MLTYLIFAVILCSSQVTLCASSSRHSPHHIHFSNGVIQLIIEAYTEEVLREMAARRDLQLSHEQSVVLRQRMRDLYDYIRHHPALYQRYLWVGKGRPDNDPESPYPMQGERKEFQTRGSSKRKRNLDDDASLSSGSETSVSSTTEQKRNQASAFPAQEICKTNRQWIQVNNTHDTNQNEVQVIQESMQQWVFAYLCAAQAGPCIGISPLYDSECTERLGWMYMYHVPVNDPLHEPRWGFVATPHHCACKITPKYIQDS